MYSIGGGSCQVNLSGYSCGTVLNPRLNEPAATLARACVAVRRFDRAGRKANGPLAGRGFCSNGNDRADDWAIRSARYSIGPLLDRDEDRVADLALDMIGEMALAGGVLNQDHVAGGDKGVLAIGGGDLYAGVEVEDVLPARRRVPVDIMLGLGLAKDHPGGRQFLRQFAAAALFDPFDLDVAEMRLAVGISIEIVDLHRVSPLDWRRFIPPLVPSAIPRRRPASPRGRSDAGWR